MPRPHRASSVLIAAIGLTLTVSVAIAAAPAPAFQNAVTEFSSASAGNASSVDKAADAFGELLKAEPTNPVLMAYAGASTAMKATTTSLPWKKMGYAEDGLAQLDKSLAMLTLAHDAPIQRNVAGSLEVKFVAANTFLAVPGFMNRGARGAKLLNEVLGSPLFAAAPLPFKGQVWMRAAALANSEHRGAEARRYFDEVIGAGAPQAEAARAGLKQVAP